MIEIKARSYWGMRKNSNQTRLTWCKWIIIFALEYLSDVSKNIVWIFLLSSQFWACHSSHNSQWQAWWHRETSWDASGSSLRCHRLCLMTRLASSVSSSWSHLMPQRRERVRMARSPSQTRCPAQQLAGIRRSGSRWRVLLGKHGFLDHVEDDLVGHELASFHHLIELLAALGSWLDFSTEQVTAREMSVSELLDDLFALCSFSTAWTANDKDDFGAL